MLQTKTWSSKHTVTGGLHTHIILLFAGAAVVILAGAGPDCLDALEVIIPGPVYALHTHTHTHTHTAQPPTQTTHTSIPTH